MFTRKACSLMFGTVIAVLAHGAVAQTYEMTLHTIGSGGGSGAGNELEFNCTIGQPIAGIGASGNYILFGGYWGAASRTTAPGDCNRDGIVQLNDFACFANCFTGIDREAAAECAVFDLDSDSDVDGDDYKAFSAQLGT